MIEDLLNTTNLEEKSESGDVLNNGIYLFLDVNKDYNHVDLTEEFFDLNGVIVEKKTPSNENYLDQLKWIARKGFAVSGNKQIQSVKGSLNIVSNLLTFTNATKIDDLVFTSKGKDKMDTFLDSFNEQSFVDMYTGMLDIPLKNTNYEQVGLSQKEARVILSDYQDKLNLEFFDNDMSFAKISEERSQQTKQFIANNHQFFKNYIALFDKNSTSFLKSKKTLRINIIFGEFDDVSEKEALSYYKSKLILKSEENSFDFNTGMGYFITSISNSRSVKKPFLEQNKRDSIENYNYRIPMTQDYLAKNYYVFNYLNTVQAKTGQINFEVYVRNNEIVDTKDEIGTVVYKFFKDKLDLFYINKYVVTRNVRQDREIDFNFQFLSQGVVETKNIPTALELQTAIFGKRSELTGVGGMINAFGDSAKINAMFKEGGKSLPVFWDFKQAFDDYNRYASNSLPLHVQNYSSKIIQGVDFHESTLAIARTLRHNVFFFWKKMEEFVNLNSDYTQLINYSESTVDKHVSDLVIETEQDFYYYVGQALYYIMRSANEVVKDKYLDYDISTYFSNKNKRMALLRLQQILKENSYIFEQVAKSYEMAYEQVLIVQLVEKLSLFDLNTIGYNYDYLALGFLDRKNILFNKKKGE